MKSVRWFHLMVVAEMFLHVPSSDAAIEPHPAQPLLNEKAGLRGLMVGERTVALYGVPIEVNGHDNPIRRTRVRRYSYGVIKDGVPGNCLCNNGAAGRVGCVGHSCRRLRFRDRPPSDDAEKFHPKGH